MLYIRKLSKKANLYKIKSAETNSIIDADVLKQEFGTSQNTLSFWKCDDLGSTQDAMKAILLSTTSINTSQFIIVDDQLLNKYDIKVSYKDKGVTAYKGFEDLHVNFCELTYEKIGLLLDLFKEISKKEEFTPELKKQEVKNYIIEARDSGLINEESLQPDLQRDIERYCK